MGSPAETMGGWAAQAAPTLDAEGWQRAEREAARVPDGGPANRWSVAQARALLAYRDRVAKWLTKAQRRTLKWYMVGGGSGGRGGAVVLRSMEEKRLARSGGHEPWNLSVELADFGCEVARVMEVRRGE